MNASLASPELLAQAPELAALEVLDQAAGTTFRALLAAHPELCEPDFLLEVASITPQLCLASAVVSAIHTLCNALADYRAFTEGRTQIRSFDHDVPF